MKSIYVRTVGSERKASLDIPSHQLAHILELAAVQLRSVRSEDDCSIHVQRLVSSLQRELAQADYAEYLDHISR